MNTMKKLEGQDRCAVEAAILRNVEAKTVCKRDENFIPVLVQGLLGGLGGKLVQCVKRAFSTHPNYSSLQP